MKKYRVLIEGGFEGLEFADLSIKFSNGSIRPLRVKKGEFIPVDQLDPQDFQKSLKFGSLARSLKAGWVSEETGDGGRSSQAEKPISPAPLVVSTGKGAVAEAPADDRHREMPSHKVGHGAKVILPQPQEGPKNFELKVTGNVDFTTVHSNKDLNTLAQATKLRFIEWCRDASLLKEIASKSPSETIKTAAKSRVRELQHEQTNSES